MGMDHHVHLHSAWTILYSEQVEGMAPSLPVEDAGISSNSHGATYSADESVGLLSSVCCRAIPVTPSFTLHHHPWTGIVRIQ